MNYVSNFGYYVIGITLIVSTFGFFKYKQMSYEILRTEKGLNILHITASNLNTINGWRIEFDDGKEAMLYQHSGEWRQHNENWLDEITLMAVGNCIDTSLVRRSPVHRQLLPLDLTMKKN